ncbi:MAG: hypothetical protein PHT19_11940 [Methylococcus sp.]|nr:hypothetical protein [Methylococcus sp.]
MTDLPSERKAPDFLSLAQFAGVLEQAGVADPLKRIRDLLRIPNTYPPAGLKLFLGAWWIGSDDPCLSTEQARHALNAAQQYVARGMTMDEALAVEVEVQEEDSGDSSDTLMVDLAEAADGALAPEALSELARVVQCAEPETNRAWLGELWIRRLNVSATYRSAGENRYPWTDDKGGWGWLAVPQFEPVESVLRRAGGDLIDLRDRAARGKIAVRVEVAEAIPKNGSDETRFVRDIALDPSSGAQLLKGWPGPDLALTDFARYQPGCRLNVSAIAVKLADDVTCRWVEEDVDCVVTRSRLTDAEARDLAACKDLYLDDFLKLTGDVGPTGGRACRSGDYELSHVGVRFALLDGEEPKLFAAEAEELRRIERESRLAFPCTPKQMADFFREAEEFEAHPVFIDAVQLTYLIDVDEPQEPNSPSSRKPQGPRKGLVGLMMDRAKRLSGPLPNGQIPEFTTVWDDLKKKPPADTSYSEEERMFYAKDGETLVRDNARRAYNKHANRS